MPVKTYSYNKYRKLNKNSYNKKLYKTYKKYINNKTIKQYYNSKKKSLNKSLSSLSRNKSLSSLSSSLSSLSRNKMRGGFSKCNSSDVTVTEAGFNIPALGGIDGLSISESRGAIYRPANVSDTYHAMT